MDELLYQLFHVVLVIRIGCKIIAYARLQNKFNFKLKVYQRRNMIISSTIIRF